MANTRSGKIANRKSIRRTEVNRTRKSRIRASLRKLSEAITKGDHKGAMEAFKLAQSELNTGVSKNLIKKNTASRRVSRLNAQVKALASNNNTKKSA